MKLINITDNLRTEFDAKIKAESLSMRQAQELTGVSFSTISRFLRGDEITSTTYDRISAWISGTSLPKRKVVQSKRITIGKQGFLITIEALPPPPEKKE